MDNPTHMQPSPQQNRWDSIDSIADDIRSCTICPLHKTRTKAVPGDGSSFASFMFVGEGPGQNEDSQGLPFVGRAGHILDEMLSLVPLNREDVFITNVVKCRPPSNRDPQPDEVKACASYLNEQIRLLNPKVIVPLGRHSLQWFCREGKIGNDHGRIIEKDGRVLFPLYHPAAALRNTQVMEHLRRDIKGLPKALRHAISMKAKASSATDEFKKML